jgi:hypothetical protein
VDLVATVEQGRYIAIDAATTLSRFLVEGRFHSDRFAKSFGKLIMKAARNVTGEHSRVAVFGEGTDLLWKQGNTEAAIQNEKLCNELIKKYDVNILCAYCMDDAQNIVEEEGQRQICAEHSEVFRVLKQKWKDTSGSE